MISILLPGMMSLLPKRLYIGMCIAVGRYRRVVRMVCGGVSCIEMVCGFFFTATDGV